ncbi:MAG: hypothetical protein LQ348_002439 [Seirophora lacunosa]|nr:MAG: hypothetical protein LQ348_002439 [Seirophora lacunosa]
MTSTLVVIDSSARRTTIRTTPSKVLSDVLQEACGKLGVDSTQYGLKSVTQLHSILDLSNPVRLSGLSPGAKLELILVSRSPSVVSVALQLPESEAHGLPGGRIIEKYPSNTTLWLVLRNFENMAPHRNFTQRGKIMTENGESGAGRLYHEAPVLNILGRELTSFTDLQKTLAQLGFNSGSVLLRLSFRVSETPLEEAMDQIEQYFRAVQGETQAGAHATSMTNSETDPDTSAQMVSERDNGAKSPLEPLSPTSDGEKPTQTPNTHQTTNLFTHEPPPPAMTSPSQRPMTVYKIPASSTPRAAQKEFRDADFDPTIRQAKLHQARLQNEGRNKTLLSDKELAEKEAAKARKLADIKEVEIRMRLSDDIVVDLTFSHLETAETLYDTVKQALNNENEPFTLNFRLAKGIRTIPRVGTLKLVSDLGMSGRTYINLVWGEEASIRSRNMPVVKEHLQAQAKELEVPEVAEVDVPEETGETSTAGKQLGKITSSSKGGKPKWMNKLIKR